MAGVFGLPFVVMSVFLVLAESARSAWPSMVGEICLPRLSLVQRILIGIPYFVGTIVVLFWFPLFFAGVVYGDAL
jgi:hypothetical protein